MIHPKAGPENTESTLRAALDVCEKKAIPHIVVASTRGETALKLAALSKWTTLNRIVVTHNTGFAEAGEQELSLEIRKALEASGIKVLTGTLALRGVGAAIRRKLGGFSQEEIINNTLRLFGQGMKVCVEIAMMATDAGLVPETDIVAVAGTAWGADTAVIIHARPSHRFFDLRIREIIAKPWEF